MVEVFLCCAITVHFAGLLNCIGGTIAFIFDANFAC